MLDTYLTIMKVNFNTNIGISYHQYDTQNKQNKTVTNVIDDKKFVPQKISFNGMTKQMKSHTYIDGQKDIIKIINTHKDKSLIVGKLPSFIINKLPKENKAEAIKEIYDTFDDITLELRNFDEMKATKIEEIQKYRYSSTVDKLNNVFKKYKIINDWDDIDIQYLGKGGKGAGYKIEGLIDSNSFDEDEYVIKVFHFIEGENWQNYKSHGCYAETNSAAYWMEKAGKQTNRGKFFWGNLKTGYIVNKYIDEDIRIPKRTVDSYTYGLKCTDEDLKKKHNTCKGYSFDWGGVRVINRVRNGNDIARYVAKRIENTEKKYRLQEWNRLLYDKHINQSSKNAGLAMSIKYLDNKTHYIDICLKMNDAKVNQGLAYVLKYLPYKQSLKYFEKLVKTDDVVTQIILFNEIPLLAMKHRDENIKDDLQTIRSAILCSRIKNYYDISEANALPETIEHLASFVHLLPKDSFKAYYSRLAKTDNLALQDRLIYKLSNVDNENKLFAIREIAKHLKDENLKKKIL